MLRITALGYCVLRRFPYISYQGDCGHEIHKVVMHITGRELGNERGIDWAYITEVDKNTV